MNPVATVNQIPVTKEDCITTEVLTAALASKQFTDWLASMDHFFFDIRGIHFQSVDMFGKRVGFIKFKADIADKSGKPVSGIVFMRGGSVGILPVLTCKGRQYAVLTVQPRVATGSFAFREIPAGMLDGSGNFAGVAANEMEEELGLKINSNELIDLSGKAGHDRGFFVSSGGSDETIRLFAFCKEVTEEELAAINGKCTGVQEENEQITLQVAPLEDLWKIPDGKTIVAYTLYCKLVQEAPAPATVLSGVFC